MALGTPGGQSGSSLQSSDTVLFYFLSCLFCGPLSCEPWQTETLTLMGACFSFLQVPKYLFTVVQFQSGDKVYLLKCMLTQDRDLHNGPLSASVTLQRGAVCVRVVSQGRAVLYVTVCGLRMSGRGSGATGNQILSEVIKRRLRLRFLHVLRLTHRINERWCLRTSSERTSSHVSWVVRRERRITAFPQAG